MTGRLLHRSFFGCVAQVSPSNLLPVVRSDEGPLVMRVGCHSGCLINCFGGRGRDRTGDPLLAKTRKKIYLIGSLGFTLRRNTRFWT
jgi:hypothetical protein